LRVSVFQSRSVVPRFALSVLGILASFAIVPGPSGCISNKPATAPGLLAQRLRPKPIPPGPNGLFMDVIHLERPFGDRELNEDLWVTADEEQLDLAKRQKLAEHGFRVAVLGGTLPTILKTLFGEEELGQMNGEHLMIQSGVPTQIQSGGLFESWLVEEKAMDENRIVPLTNATGSLRVVPRITPDREIDLAITPEIQHGDTRKQFVPGVGTSGGMDWSIQIGRQSRALGELSFNVRLRTGQFVLISCVAQGESHGVRFFSHKKEGQTMQRVVLVNAEASHEAEAARASLR